MTPRALIAVRTVLCIGAAAGSLVLSQVVLCGAMMVTDENSYVFQAYNFRDGVIAREKPPLASQVTSEMIICDDTVGWMSRYPPGHALWLLPGTVFDNVRLMSGVAAALALWLMCCVARDLKIREPIMWIVVLASPFWLIMYGTLFSHTSGFVGTALMFWCYVRWRQRGARLYATLAGLSWAWLFLNRTYTALLLALPFGVDCLYSLCTKRSRDELLGVLSFGGAAAIGGVIYMLYNFAALGDPLMPTYLYYDYGERLGFGERSSHGREVVHDLGRGLEVMKGSLKRLDNWLYGFPGSAFFVLAAALVGWRRRWSLLLLGAPAAVYLGYVYFWFGGVYMVGPVYYFETTVFLMIALALAGERAWAAAARAPAMRVVLGLLACVLIVTGGRFTYARAMKLREARVYEGELLKRIESLPPRSLVIVEDVPEEPYMKEVVFNRAGLGTDPLRARSMGARNRALAIAYADRTPYILNGADMSLRPFDKNRPIEFSVPIYKFHRTTGVNQRTRDGQDTMRVAEEGTHAAGLLCYGRYYELSPGRYTVEFQAAIRGVEAGRPVKFDVAADSGRAVLALERLTAADPDQPVRLDVVLPNFMAIEPRVHYDGSGVTEIYAVRIKEQM